MATKLAGSLDGVHVQWVIFSRVCDYTMWKVHFDQIFWFTILLVTENFIEDSKH